MYDRLALMDSLLAATAALSLYLQILLAQNPQLDVALLLGLAMGAGLLTKSSAQFFLLLLPFSLLFFNWQQKRAGRRFLTWLFYSLIAFFLAKGIEAILRLSPFYGQIGIKNHAFILTFSEFRQAPFALFWGNLKMFTGWLGLYLSWPVLLLALLPVVRALKDWRRFLRPFKRKIAVADFSLLLFLWFAVPFVSLAFFGKSTFPRFLLFMSVPLLALAGYQLSRFLNLLSQRSFQIALVVLVFASPTIVCLQILFRPTAAVIPKPDQNQYIHDWPAGWGIKEVVAFLNEQQKKGKVLVGTEGTFGLLPHALELYFWDNPNVEIKSYWPVAEIPEDFLARARQQPSYFIYYQDQTHPRHSPVKLIAKYRQGHGHSYLRLYQVLP